MQVSEFRIDCGKTLFLCTRLQGCRRYDYMEVIGRVEFGTETECKAGAVAEDVLYADFSGEKKSARANMRATLLSHEKISIC
jgi:hypothetical protein